MLCLDPIMRGRGLKTTANDGLSELICLFSTANTENDDACVRVA